VYKSAQIIVHSRLGERVSLPSKQFDISADNTVICTQKMTDKVSV